MRKTIILRVILMIIILGILAYLVYVAFNAKSTTEDSMVMESNTEETNDTAMMEEVNNDNLENMNEENLNNESGDENMIATTTTTTTTTQWEGEYSYSKIEEGVTDDGEKHYTLKITQDGDAYNVVYTYSGMHLEEYETTTELTGDVLSAVLKSEPRTNLIDEPKIGDKMFTLEMAKDGKIIELKWVFNPEWEPVKFYRVTE